MKKFLALLTLAALPVVGIAGVAHADEDNGAPPVNPHITHMTVHPGGSCTSDPLHGDECGGVAPVNPTITHVVVTHESACPSGDPECVTPPTTVATGEDAAVDAELPAVVQHHRTVRQTAPTFTSEDVGQAVLMLMAPGLFLAS